MTASRARALGGCNRAGTSAATLKQRLSETAALADASCHHFLGSLLDSKLLVGPEGRLRPALFAYTDEAALSGPFKGPLDTEAGPDLVNGGDKLIAIFLGVAGGGRNSKAFLTNGDSGIVNRLDVNLVILEKHVGRGLGKLCVADEDGDDVGGVGDNGDVARVELFLDSAGVKLLKLPVAIVFHLVLNRSLGSGHGGRRQRSGEDESGSERANHVHELGTASNVAANTSVGLAEGTSNDVNAIHDGSARHALTVGFPIEMLGNTSSAGAVHADSVDFVQKGNGAILVGKVANGFNGANGAAHAVDGLKGDNLGHVQRQGGELGLEVGNIVVLEDDLLCAGVSDALNHGGVV